MLDIITRKTDRRRAFSIKKPIAAVKSGLVQKTHTIRFAMVSSYIAVTLMTLILMCVYIIGMLSDNLYSEKTTYLFAKANMISQTVTNAWDTDEPDILYLRFGDIVERSLAGTSIRGVVTNTAYTVLYDSNRESGMEGKVFMRDVLKRAIDGDQVDSMFDSDSGKTITVSVPIDRGGLIVGAVYLAENVSSTSSTINSIRTSLIVFCIAIVFIIGMLSVALSFIITQPISEFTEVARAISRGDFSLRANENGMEEIAQMGRALNFMCDELNALDEKRKNFVSDVSHELKTPMAGIKLLCDSLVEADNPDMGTVREFLGDMSEEIDRLTRLINSLLTLTRLDANSEMSLSTVDIAALCMSAVRSLKPIANEKNILVSCTEDSAGERSIEADYDKIYEAVYNLIENAIKYTPEGGLVTVATHIDGGVCKIEVIDSGAGIPEDKKQKIFERFYRLDDSRARETGGTGLGLAIAKEAVTLHKGSIEVTDAPDGGSVFTITLPA